MMLQNDSQSIIKKISHSNSPKRLTSQIKNLSIFKFQNMQSCQIHFIDCMGYYDLISQLISITFLIMILIKTIRIFIQLKKQHSFHSDQQIQKSFIRKLIINGISIVYQVFLLSSIIFSIAIFVHYKQKITEITQDKVNLWYKWSQIIFINLLNVLNITVGFLYWKAVRAFFKISENQLPLVFRAPLKVVFLLFYFYNFIVIIVTLLLFINTDQDHYEKNQIKIVNILNVIGVSCSTLICLTSRILYQKHILQIIDIRKSAIRRQKIYSFIIAFTSICRFTCVTLNLVGIDYTSKFRNFNEDCIDQTPYNAILTLFITVCINLLPPLIFSMIFTTMRRKQKKASQISQYLVKHNSQSIRYV